MVVWLVAVVE